jgi:hypothetical protein
MTARATCTVWRQPSDEGDLTTGNSCGARGPESVCRNVRNCGKTRVVGNTHQGPALFSTGPRARAGCPRNRGREIHAAHRHEVCFLGRAYDSLEYGNLFGKIHAAQECLEARVGAQAVIKRQTEIRHIGIADLGKQVRATTLKRRNYCNFAYSALASFRIGMSGSASFQSVRKS